jgi:BirA family biotin operon repressor/biotin-[acetyl-CoA-carboxylase] ligase
MFEIHLDSIDSTNTYAKLHASTFIADDITCITADEQTGGRGRFQNKWASPPGVNLYVTFYFRLPASQPHFTALGLVLAASMVQTLLAEGLTPQIKWPNDLQLNHKKFGGVLCETSLQKDHFEVFAGIGVNVNMGPGDLHAIGQPATSLKLETGKSWDRKKLLQKLQAQFVDNLEMFQQKGFAPFHHFCESLLAYKGEKVRCFDGQKEWTGICESLSQDGRLNVRLPDHSIHTFASGEVSLRVVD